MLGVELRPARQAGERLRRERLVELDGLDVAPADPGARERRFAASTGRDAEDVGVDAVRAARDDPGQRLAAEPPAGRLVADQQHRARRRSAATRCRR